MIATVLDVELQQLAMWQRQFLARLRSGPQAIAGWQVYRRSYFGNHGNALADTYCTAYALLGSQGFGPLARDYLLAHPPSAPDLNDYGLDFPDWLAANLVDCTPDGAMPWLPDLARLDRSIHLAARAADAPVMHLLDPASEDWRDQRLCWHPSVNWLSSDFPILTLYRWQQSGSDRELTLPVKGESVLVFRSGRDIQLLPMDDIDAGLIETIYAAQPFAANDLASTLPDRCGAELQELMIRLQQLFQCGAIVQLA